MKKYQEIITWVIALFISVYFILNKNNLYGLLFFGIAILVIFFNQIKEFSISKNGFKIKNLEKRIEKINEKFEQEIICGENIPKNGVIKLKKKPIKNSLFAYWSPIVMTDGIHFKLEEDKVILDYSKFSTNSSPEKIFPKTNPLVVKYLAEI